MGENSTKRIIIKFIICLFVLIFLHDYYIHLITLGIQESIQPCIQESIKNSMQEINQQHLQESIQNSTQGRIGRIFNKLYEDVIYLRLNIRLEKH